MTHTGEEEERRVRLCLLASASWLAENGPLVTVPAKLIYRSLLCGFSSFFLKISHFQVK